MLDFGRVGVLNAPHCLPTNLRFLRRAVVSASEAGLYGSHERPLNVRQDLVALATNFDIFRHRQERPFI